MIKLCNGLTYTDWIRQGSVLLGEEKNLAHFENSKELNAALNKRNSLRNSTLEEKYTEIKRVMANAYPEYSTIQRRWEKELETY